MLENFLNRHRVFRPRLMVSIAAAVVVGLCVPADTVDVGITRALIGFDTGVCLFLVLAGMMFTSASRESLMKRAAKEDEGQYVVLMLVILAAIASLAAIVFELGLVKDLKGGARTGHIAIAGLTVVASWAFTHTMFAMHYAHNYYLRQSGPSGNGGLLFPGFKDGKDGRSASGEVELDESEDQPDYLDFLYFAFIIGTSGQTADVSFTSKQMRRLGTLHCVLAFLFNTSILALCINIAASLI